MGPLVNETLDEWLLRPFQSSTTFRNLSACGVCVFHVIDDALLIVRSALSLPIELNYTRSAHGGWVIDSACHWYCLRAQNWDISQSRAEISAVVLQHQSIRPFWGWNRAKHAILEATILATRLHLTGRKKVQEELLRLEPMLKKTAGTNELIAWDLICRFVAETEPLDL